MKNYLLDKERYYINYADAVYSDFLKTRYGIKGCKPSGNSAIASMRKDLVDWQQNEDNGALTQTSISYITWLGVNYDLDEIELTNTGAGYLQSPVPHGPTNLALSYNYGTNQSQNIIEVNTGGCVTRINLNPSIQINNNASGTYVFVQELPAYTWTIDHNLGYIPNIFIQDSTGIDIDGIVDEANTTQVIISFTSPVAGTAYLS